jgi:hypothetical protein
VSTLDDLDGLGVQPFTEGGWEEIWDLQNGESGVIRFVVPGDARDAFLETVSGLDETITYPGSVTVSRKVPMVHPLFPRAFAASCVLRPPDRSLWTIPGGLTSGAMALPSWQDYIGDVRFEIPRWGLDGDYPMVTRRLDARPEVATWPGSQYKFPSDNLIVPGGVGVRVTIVDFSLTLHNLPSLNEGLYLSLAGTVNESTFYGLAPGHCLYLGPSSQGQRSFGGVSVWDVTHKFQARSRDHREIVRPFGLVAGSPWEAPQAGDGSYILPEDDHNLLWAN